MFEPYTPPKVAKSENGGVRRLLPDRGTVRNPKKVRPAITDAKEFLKLQKEFGSFDKYAWRYVGGKPIKHAFRSLSEIPSITPESDALSKDLRKRSFTFVGSTICYAFIQAVGMVNDHTTDCFRYNEIS